jgi:hypothetical protein
MTRGRCPNATCTEVQPMAAAECMIPMTTLGSPVDRKRPIVSWQNNEFFCSFELLDATHAICCEFLEWVHARSPHNHLNDDHHYASRYLYFPEVMTWNVTEIQHVPSKRIVTM